MFKWKGIYLYLANKSKCVSDKSISDKSNVNPGQIKDAMIRTQ